MTKSLILWGAGLACALGGAIAGNAVGSSQAADRSQNEMFYQSHKTATIGQHGRRLLPDHYPLVTGDGVVEVAELSNRGLFRQARYRPSDPAAGYTTDAHDGHPGFAPEDSETPALQTAPEAAADIAPAEPVPFAQDRSQDDGHAKIIDVQATLAMR